MLECDLRGTAAGRERAVSLAANTALPIPGSLAIALDSPVFPKIAFNCLAIFRTECSVFAGLLEIFESVLKVAVIHKLLIATRLCCQQ